MHTTRNALFIPAKGVQRTHAALATPAVLVLLFFLLLALVPGPAHAQQFQVPFIQEFGCSVVQWLKGPLAVVVFILVCVATIVIGMITKMDWARIISVCVLFGLLVSSGSILASSSHIQNVAGMSSCLQ